jgi:ribosomal protein S18 acetylase RimI-like enzyme
VAVKPPELLERIPAGAGRNEVLPLLLLADDSEIQVRSYYQQGDLFVLRAQTGDPIGVVLAIDRSGGTAELKAVAVAAACQGRGAGRRLIAMVLDELRARGVRRVIVGTANCSIGQLAFYQKAGFRFWRIERGFFSAARGYCEGIEENGIPLRDMVWLDQELQRPG